LNIGEDTKFVWQGKAGEISPLTDNTFYVAMIHSRNVSPKRITGSRWKTFDPERIKEIMADDWDIFRAIGKSLPS
jgi:hypothetical protein